MTCPLLVGYDRYDGIAPAQNSENIASCIRGAELSGFEGGHGFFSKTPPPFKHSLHSSKRHRIDPVKYPGARGRSETVRDCRL
jgi:pimeloyl-ACP methyl ester carboxylesterase